MKEGRQLSEQLLMFLSIFWIGYKCFSKDLLKPFNEGNLSFVSYFFPFFFIILEFVVLVYLPHLIVDVA